MSKRRTPYGKTGTFALRIALAFFSDLPYDGWSHTHKVQPKGSYNKIYNINKHSGFSAHFFQ